MRRDNGLIYKNIMKDVNNVLKNKLNNTNLYKSELYNKDQYDDITIPELFGTLQYSVIQIWRKHLQTNKHSEHVILNEFYEDIIDKVDALIEAWQSENDIVYEYQNLLCDEEMSAVEYLEELKRITKKGYELLYNNEYKSLCDDILNLINSTLYKLKRLTEKLNYRR